MSIRRQGLVVSRFSETDDVGYPVTAGGHLPSDEAAVAAEPDDFGAHDRGHAARENLLEARNPFRKRWRAHISLVAARAEASQRFAFPEVADAPPRQLRFQDFFVDLRIPPRARKVADVNQLGDAMLAEQRNELIQRPRRVSDGEQADRGRRLAMLRVPAAGRKHRIARFEMPLAGVIGVRWIFAGIH